MQEGKGKRPLSAELGLPSPTDLLLHLFIWVKRKFVHVSTFGKYVSEQNCVFLQLLIKRMFLGIYICY